MAEAERKFEKYKRREKKKNKQKKKKKESVSYGSGLITFCPAALMSLRWLRFSADPFSFLSPFGLRLRPGQCNRIVVPKAIGFLSAAVGEANSGCALIATILETVDRSIVWERHESSTQGIVTTRFTPRGGGRNLAPIHFRLYRRVRPGNPVGNLFPVLGNLIGARMELFVILVFHVTGLYLLSLSLSE